ncbi:hypothetical protein PDE_05823 [Penicillium oxalicum 114-2]|uniref:Uncharacterized protein n=1 Tax=Penicillium oxalicum (strain 114-2 / CGMCC 5302) TaxID=933388 RepID=S7ZQG9_PENO1|nr:hypothetical protein PDE_05823 [Penicillium oxalicum 114-2]
MERSEGIIPGPAYSCFSSLQNGAERRFDELLHFKFNELAESVMVKIACATRHLSRGIAHITETTPDSRHKSQ